MFRYARKSDYGGRLKPDSDTKYYQRLFLKDHLPRYITSEARVMEIGANTVFEILLSLPARERWIADPYDGRDGGQALAPQVQHGIYISRCLIGINSEALPTDFFDLIFSSSVLEHIGQQEVDYDCFPADIPPPEQEAPRDVLCAEIFRLTKPGGVTVHAIDHGVRNISYARNFLNAGFVFLENDPPITPYLMARDPDALRQTRCWLEPEKPLEDTYLHTVLLLGFRKPAN